MALGRPVSTRCRRDDIAPARPGANPAATVCWRGSKSRRRAACSSPWSGCCPTQSCSALQDVVRNLSDIRLTPAQYRTEQIPTFIIWRVRRPCLGEGYWGRKHRGADRDRQPLPRRRTFRRASTDGDYCGWRAPGVTVTTTSACAELLPLRYFWNLCVHSLIRPHHGTSAQSDQWCSWGPPVRRMAISILLRQFEPLAADSVPYDSALQAPCYEGRWQQICMLRLAVDRLILAA